MNEERKGKYFLRTTGQAAFGTSKLIRRGFRSVHCSERTSLLYERFKQSGSKSLGMFRTVIEVIATRTRLCGWGIHRKGTRPLSNGIVHQNQLPLQCTRLRYNEFPNVLTRHRAVRSVFRQSCCPPLFVPNIISVPCVRNLLPVRLHSTRRSSYFSHNTAYDRRSNLQNSSSH